MNDLKQLRSDVRLKLDRTTVESLLSYYGIEITKDHSFKEDPSFKVFKDGFIHDFGKTAFHGDIVSFLHDIKDVPLKKALYWVCDALRVSYDK